MLLWNDWEISLARNEILVWIDGFLLVWNDIGANCMWGVSAIKYRIIHNHENYKYIVLDVNQCFYFELLDMFKSEGGRF